MPIERQAKRGRPALYCSPQCRKTGARSRRPPSASPVDELDFARAVRSAITRRGSSLRELAAQLERFGPLSTSLATLSDWQSGNSLPTSTARGRDRVLALERCLGIPAGDLAMLLPRPPTQPSRRPWPRAADAAGTTSTRYEELRRRIATLSGAQDLIQVAMSKHLVVGSRRRHVSTEAAMTIRAAHDDVDRYWFIHAHGPGEPGVVLPKVGCRVARVLDESKAASTGSVRLTAVELLFDRVLQRGEHYAFSFAVAGPDDSPPSYATESFRHVQTRPAERLELSVQFATNATALEIAECRWRERDLAEVWRRPVHPDSRFRLTLAVDDPVPGGYGWSWRFAAGDSAADASERSA